MNEANSGGLFRTHDCYPSRAGETLFGSPKSNHLYYLKLDFKKIIKSN